MSDAVLIAIVGAAGTILTVGFTSLLTYWTAKIKADAAEIKAVATEVKAVAAEIKTDAAIIKAEVSEVKADVTEVKKVTDGTHSLVNSASLALLRSNAYLTRRISMGPDATQADIDAAILAEKLVTEHEAKQAKADAKE